MALISVFFLLSVVILTVFRLRCVLPPTRSSSKRLFIHKWIPWLGSASAPLFLRDRRYGDGHSASSILGHSILDPAVFLLRAFLLIPQIVLVLHPILLSLELLLMVSAHAVIYEAWYTNGILLVLNALLCRFVSLLLDLSLLSQIVLAFSVTC